MVRVQATSRYTDRIVLSSDLPDPDAAQREVVSWAHENDFVLLPGVRRLSAFEKGRLIGEFVLAVGHRQPRNENN